MTLDIRAGMFAALRDGDVVGPLAKVTKRSELYHHVWNILGYRYGRWNDEGEDGDAFAIGPQPGDIVSVHATRAEALAYVADNPMNRELYEDGPDLASVPQTVRAEDMTDWSDLPDVYVTSAKRIDGIFWEITACSVPMAIGPEVRLVVAPAPVVVDWQARAKWPDGVTEMRVCGDAVELDFAHGMVALKDWTITYYADEARKIAAVLIAAADALDAAAKEPRHE